MHFLNGNNVDKLRATAARGARRSQMRSVPSSWRWTFAVLPAMAEVVRSTADSQTMGDLSAARRATAD